MRVFLTIILPLMAPSLLYMGWILLRSQAGQSAGQGDGGGLARVLARDVPWATLVIAGAVLTGVVTTALYVTQETGAPGEVYVPPRFEDGRIIPGEVRHRTDPAAPE
ncbi:hypothetical protein F1188_14585 [Roseospira marina]|uniref:Uncharacterized protein n=1 Tax=Roseospira marina TaxID=140057 RepID=A0A5M6I8Q0_9PROT|nr:hypothetical protein [Roseospira marina]KAA5604640.1 hypothetical protein F1188_14585 [Roseospira marina]MBB4315082.1 hypothetical protein [Roseospira marina]MBB5088148.1 hypothetical protein [Roseospira marina]